MKKLAILGASGHGSVVADIAEVCGYDKIYFFDDAWPQIKQHHDWLVSGDTKSLIDELNTFDACIVAIGNCSVRSKKHQLLGKHGARFATLVHPSAIISKYAILGKGTIVCEGAIVKAFSQIGDACIVNTSSTIGHDVTVKNGVHISLGANIAGNVTIGENSWLGIGSTVRECVSIGQNVMVGAGAVVVKPIDDAITVVGNPASELVKNA